MEEQQQQSGGRRSRKEADALAAAYEASGLSREEFSKQRGVPENTLARYIARFRREQKGAQGAARWVAVEVEKPGGDRGALVVELSRGRRIEVQRGFDLETFRRLVAELERV